MAILSKIRERGLFLILIIGLALFAFVASPQKLLSYFRSNKAGVVGIINGEEVSRKQFQAKIKQIKSYNPKAKDDQITKQVWDDIVKEKIYTAQLEKAGVDIGEKDLWEAIISDPSIKNNQTFQNEVGMFDEDLLRNYIQDLKDNKDEDGGRRWASWLNYEDAKRKQLRQQTYLNLIKAGIVPTLAEAKTDYIVHNTVVSGKLVRLPYTSIPDSAVVVTDTDIKNYIDQHPKKFTVKPSRNMRYIVFEMKASEEDKQQLREELEKLKPELAKTPEKDLVEFVDANSDLSYQDVFLSKKSFDPKVADTLFNMNKGDVYGVYEEKNYYKISRLVDIDPVFQAKASHILIAYKGARSAKDDITRTKEEARVKALKLLKKANADNFADLAIKESDGPSGSRGGSLGTFGKGQMVPAFNDWVFSHKKGDIGMVETEFGFHIIYMEDTVEGRKFATVAKLIAPSEKTENQIFIDAESFVSEINKGASFEELAKEKKYNIKLANNIHKQDSKIPGIEEGQSQIIRWAFDDNTKTGDAKRFQLTKSYVVFQLTGKQKEGLMNIAEARGKLERQLRIDKKAEILKKKMESGTLEEIAEQNLTQVKNTGDISMENPNRGLLGNDNNIVVGAMIGMDEGQILRGIKGTLAVYAVQLVKKTPPVELESYEAIREQMAEKAGKINSNQVFEALKETAEIKDYR